MMPLPSPPFIESTLCPLSIRPPSHEKPGVSRLLLLFQVNPEPEYRPPPVQLFISHCLNPCVHLLSIHPLTISTSCRIYMPLSVIYFLFSLAKHSNHEKRNHLNAFSFAWLDGQ